MNRISAKIVEDSISERGHRITTMELVFPRYILAELNTHRVFSKNSASSRAIPFSKMVKSVEENPFIPIAWQKDHKGMQGTEYFLQNDVIDWSNMSGNISAQKGLTKLWLESSVLAVDCAKELHRAGLTKQLCNRLLEPFMYHKVLLTATEFENFFKLRCPSYQSPVDKDYFYKSKKELIDNHSNPDNLKRFNEFSVTDWLEINKGQAEIHIMDLAEKMYDALNESEPQLLQPGEWHIPYGDNIERNLVQSAALALANKDPKYSYLLDETPEMIVLMVATARCARLSYQTLGDNPKIDYKKDIILYHDLLEEAHMSPFEHCAQVMDQDTYYNSSLSFPIDENASQTRFGICRNFIGFKQLRVLVEET